MGISSVSMRMTVVMCGLTDKGAGLDMPLGLGTAKRCGHLVFKAMDDAVHQSQQRHHEQSQG